MKSFIFVVTILSTTNLLANECINALKRDFNFYKKRYNLTMQYSYQMLERDEVLDISSRFKNDQWLKDALDNEKEIQVSGSKIYYSNKGYGELICNIDNKSIYNSYPENEVLGIEKRCNEIIMTTHGLPKYKVLKTIISKKDDQIRTELIYPEVSDYQLKSKAYFDDIKLFFRVIAVHKLDSKNEYKLVDLQLIQKMKIANNIIDINSNECL